ncbi:acyltransferase family protein [Synechococcus sp. J7-Johnson]|uniref:acyltransferase family protein n=1 Tax=Synechococcus sp. J7-Johnson TaxID=2823737 RepID=UPI0020CFDCA4|nr:acyltransferase [Synechococcus sp. J7-Johnson]MCP9841544.1 acyltransferase family protein [Synechococcus sp. J7-Johnson]
MGRIRPIDDLRSAVIVLVVAHHAALAYIRHAHHDPAHYIRSTAPVVDPDRWWPLDVLVSWNDQFFMALLFLLSGLFVLPALRRKGVRRFLLERGQRLGLPFLVAAGLLSPLAFYPSWLMGGQKDGLPFWQRYYGIDGWSPGPAWFLWLLLAFSLGVALAYALAPARLRRWSWQPRSSGRLMAVCLAASWIASGAMARVVGANHWFTLVGPMSAQTSRLLLYAAWFLLGVALGAGNLEEALSLTLLRPWRHWAVVGALAYLLTVVLQAQPAGLAAQPPFSLRLALAFSSAACATFTILAALGFARRHLGTPSRLAESLRQNSYGIFLLHYPLVTWSQFVLLGAPLPAALKFLVSFGVALSGSWLLTILLRRTPVGRVI